MNNVHEDAREQLAAAVGFLTAALTTDWRDPLLPEVLSGFAQGGENFTRALASIALRLAAVAAEACGVDALEILRVVGLEVRAEE